MYKALHKDTKEVRAIKLVDKRHISRAHEATLRHEINVLKQLVGKGEKRGVGPPTYREAV